MPRIEYTERYMSGKIALSQVPSNKIASVVKACYRVLHLNRDSRQVTITTKSPEFAQVMFALNTLWTIGFDQQRIKVDAGTTFWRKLRRNPKHGTLAIMGCSHKYIVKRKCTKMLILPPVDTNGYAIHTEPFCSAIYISGNEWILGCTSGNPYAVSDPNFEPWDEPFHSDVD